MALIADYALIGDGETAALVSNTGSIDWLCWPRFDSGACFAALIGSPGNGRWLLGPTEDQSHVSRRYDGDTLILRTEFETASGAVRIVDFMPIGEGISRVVRLVIGLQGEVSMRGEVQLKFDYGLVPPWVEPVEDGFLARIGPDLAVLRATVAMECVDNRVGATFRIAAGEQVVFDLAYGSSTEDPPPPVRAEDALRTTKEFWLDWIGRFDRPTRWPDAVRRSLLTLKALIHRKTGGLVAAATTSVPEQAGGTMNWDYRYCWLRDSAFTLSALLNAGYHEEAKAWRDWIVRAVGGAPDKLRIMYRVDGSRHVPEWTLDWLDGYQWAKPVRVGNAASTQHQVDVYGELVDALHLAARAGIAHSPESLRLEKALIEHLEEVWNTPGQGLWESRKESRHYTYSRAMAWVGLDCFIKDAGQAHDVDAGTLERLKSLRARIHEEVCRDGYNEGIGAFVEYFGGHELDASVLLLPLVGFLPIDDPRITSTIATIERVLMRDGLLFRKELGPGVSEGAFLACSFWLADCRHMQGRTEEARELLERVLALRNDVGLLSEEYDTVGRRLCGNFPQALSHLALVTTALGLSGPILQRGGG